MNLKKILDYSSDVYAHASKVAKDRGRGAQSQRLAKGASEKLYQELRDYEPDGSEPAKPINSEPVKPEVSPESEPAYDELWVDLGLPSGTLWRACEEDGYYTFEEAKAEFGSSLPTREQFQELLDNCDYEWDEKKKGVYFTSRINGNYLYFPALGFRRNGSDVRNIGSSGGYWSSSKTYNSYAEYLLLTGSDIGIYHGDCDYGQSVIIVK